jgi:hypothetical protein
MDNQKNIIDFDYASKCWRANKKYVGNGVFRYKCSHISNTTNKYCDNKCFSSIYCKYHAQIYKYKNPNK